MNDEQRIAHYREHQAHAVAAIADIDSGHHRFFEALGSEPMRDVTDQRRAELVSKADMFEGIARAWEELAAKKRDDALGPE